jgi:hypothetical protein
MPYLSKADELNILDIAIASLGDQSYLGPYFSKVRAEIWRDITSDFEPSPLTPAESGRQADRILQNARESAELARKQATEQADGIRARARQDANKIRDQILQTADQAVHLALKRLEDARELR